MPWFVLPCQLQLTTLSPFVPCPALGPGEATALPCHLKLRGELPAVELCNFWDSGPESLLFD